MTINFEMKPDAIYFIPLGGCNFFGVNMNLYGYRGKWIMVDCGLGFADETMPGVDIILPSPDFAASLGDDLLGIFITHGHDDHIGAIQYLWPKIKKPIYATNLALERIKAAVSEHPWGSQTMLREVELGGTVELGPFTVRYINMAHSIPESSLLAVSVKEVGVIAHTGDWKIDLNPVEGQTTDEEALAELGNSGVLAMVGDSTNAMVPGHSGSEIDVQKNLIDLFGEFKSKIAVTCISTSIGRINSIYTAANENGRQVCLVGRALKRIDEIARRCGYFKGIPAFIDEDEAARLPANKVLYICTGSQGEPRAALFRIAAGENRRVGFGKGDMVAFSSRIIPGNEKSIDRVKNRFYALGCDVITPRDAPIYASGHPCREEIRQLYGWLKPQIAVPVHGEQMMQEKHADLARECGIKNVFIPADGNVIKINKNGTAAVISSIEIGLLAIEGNRIVAVDHEAIMVRKRIMYNGSAVVTIVVDERGVLLADPKVTALGLLDENCELDSKYIADVIKELKSVIKNMHKDDRRDDEVMAENIRIATRKFFNARFDRKPQTRVHLVRI